MLKTVPWPVSKLFVRIFYSRIFSVIQKFFIFSDSIISFNCIKEFFDFPEFVLDIFKCSRFFMSSFLAFRDFLHFKHFICRSSFQLWDIGSFFLTFSHIFAVFHILIIFSGTQEFFATFSEISDFLNFR